MSGDDLPDYFVDGIVEEIITALSRFSTPFVIARNSNFICKGRAIDVKHAGRELGVRYVLAGSVRKGGRHVRIGGQLIDAATGAHIRADRFDASLGLNPGVFDGRPPFLGVGLHERAERRPQIGAAGCLAMLSCLSRLSRSSACRRSGNVPGCLATWNSG